jgi:hypothetical protein
MVINDLFGAGLSECGLGFAVLFFAWMLALRRESTKDQVLHEIVKNKSGAVIVSGSRGLSLNFDILKNRAREVQDNHED